MATPKLIETRGEEPTVLPGQGAEAWMRVELGMGAASPMRPLGESPEAVGPARRRPLVRVAMVLGIGLLILVIGAVIASFLRG